MGKRELQEMAVKIAMEAMMTERTRCLWCADTVVQILADKIQSKFLLSAHAEQLAKVKLEIARGVVQELRHAIVSGVRPPVRPGATDSTAGAAPVEIQ